MRIQFRKAILLLAVIVTALNNNLFAQSKQEKQAHVDSLNAVFNDLQQTDFKKAEELTNEALKLSIESGYLFGEANARTNLSVVHYRKGNYTKAIEQCFEAIKIYDKEESLKNTSNYGLVFLKLASTLHTANDYSRSIAYAHNAVAIAKRLNDNKLLALAYEELGNNNNSLQRFDSALLYYRQAKNTYYQINAFVNIADIENNTGIIYFYKGDFKEAIAHYSEALSLNRKYDRHFSSINGLYNIAEAYYMLKSYSISLNYSDSAQFYAQQLNALGNLLDIYLLKAKTYQSTGNLDSATRYYENTIALKDSIYNDNYKKELAALQTQSDVYKKETENKLLAKNKRIAVLYRNLAIAGIVGLIVVLAFLLVTQRLRIHRRVKDKLEEEVALRTKEIFRQKETIFHTNLRLKLALNGAKFDSRFVFNAFNTIQQLVLQQKTKEAQSHLVQLSKLIQYVLEKSSLDRVPLQEELQMVESYIQLEQLRLNYCFDYKLTVNAGEQNTIPALLIQSFVENAILNGIAQTSEGNSQLLLQIEASNDTLNVVIVDTGINRKKERRNRHNLPGSQLGKERLDLLTHLTHKNHLAIVEEWENENGNSGTKVTLQIPLSGQAISPEEELVNENFGSTY
jgi:tetratricopeptide (TPR) repeat protein